MTPERAVVLLRAAVASLNTFIEEAEAIDRAHPGAASHLVLTMKQARLSLEIMMEREGG